MIFRRSNYPPIEHRPAGWRPWENEDPQPRARIPYGMVIVLSFVCCCMPLSGLSGYYVYANQPEPTPTATQPPSSTPISTVTPTFTPTHTPMPSSTPTHTPTDLPTATPTYTPTATHTPSVTPTHTITSTATPMPARGIISRGPANLRAGAGTLYDVKTTLKTGTIFDVTFLAHGNDNYIWYEIVVTGGAKPGATGWIREDLIEVIER